MRCENLFSSLGIGHVEHDLWHNYKPKMKLRYFVLMIFILFIFFCCYCWLIEWASFYFVRCNMIFHYLILHFFFILLLWLCVKRCDFFFVSYFLSPYTKIKNKKKSFASDFNSIPICVLFSPISFRFVPPKKKKNIQWTFFFLSI